MNEYETRNFWLQNESKSIRKIESEETYLLRVHGTTDPVLQKQHEYEKKMILFAAQHNLLTVPIVLIDPPGRDNWSHLAASDLNLLHAFAKKAGIPRSYFSMYNGKKNIYRPHYDVRSGLSFNEVMKAGATLVSSKVVSELIFEFHTKPYNLR